jgi:HTH-type transcriptional regulator/antitoxin HipB
MWIRTVGDIAQLVRERRMELGLSQLELARKAGVSRQWIVDLEHGKPTAEVSLVLQTLAATGLHLDAHDPHQRRQVTNVGGTDLLDAADQVLEQHRLGGIRPRTLSTRPPRTLDDQKVTPASTGSRKRENKP